MPPSGVKLISHDELLRLEELYDAMSKFVSLFGINKIRLTGGEPLMRRNIEWLIERLALLPGVDDLAMTTNGIFLLDKAPVLFSSGLRRLNVSIDSLRHDRYHEITRGGNLDSVLTGLEMVREIGFNPIKINVVLYPGFDEEIDFIEWANNEGYLVRFIEMMPGAYQYTDMGNSASPKMTDILARLRNKFGTIVESEEFKNQPGRNSLHFRIPDKNWDFEIIPTISSHFCDVCNRLRLNSQGLLRICLFSNEMLNIKPLLAKSDSEFADEIMKFVQLKNSKSLNSIGSFMSSIGG
jgi:cyclic pyranopterin phosphate synthase